MSVFIPGRDFYASWAEQGKGRGLVQRLREAGKAGAMRRLRAWQSKATGKIHRLMSPDLTRGITCEFTDVTDHEREPRRTGLVRARFNDSTRPVTFQCAQSAQRRQNGRDPADGDRWLQENRGIMTFDDAMDQTFSHPEWLARISRTLQQWMLDLTRDEFDIKWKAGE